MVAGERSRGDPYRHPRGRHPRPCPRDGQQSGRQTPVQRHQHRSPRPVTLKTESPFVALVLSREFRSRRKSLRASASRPQLGPGSAAKTAWPRSLAGPILTRRSVPGLILSNRPVSRRLPFRCAARSHDRASEGKAAVPTLHRGPAAGDDPAVALDGDTVCLILAGKPD